MHFYVNKHICLVNICRGADLGFLYNHASRVAIMANPNIPPLVSTGGGTVGEPPWPAGRAKFADIVVARPQPLPEVEIPMREPKLVQ